MGKGLSNVLNYGAQVVGSPQMQSVLYGNSNMGSLSWGEITQMYRVLTHQLEVIMILLKKNYLRSVKWLGKPVKSDHAKFLRISIDR